MAILVQSTSARHRAQHRWMAVAALGVLAYFGVAMINVFRGQLNADEGWYLYASRLVYQGQLAYRDFMFTQMPLLPYVYGLPQRLLGQSLILGRLTSVALTMVGLAAGMRVARKIGGWPAAAAAAWLLAAFTYGVYYQMLVKTYALVSCCLLLVLWCLVDRGPEELRLPLAALSVLAAAFTRLSALASVAIILPYVLIIARRRRTRFAVLGVVCAVALISAYLWGPVLGLARWNTLTYHMQRWPSGPMFERLVEILVDRLPEVAETYGAYCVLGLTLALTVLRLDACHLRAQPQASLGIYGAALIAFVLANFAGGGWHREYLVPAMVAALPLMAILASRLAWRMGAPGRQFVASLLLGAMILAPIGHGLDRTDLLEETRSLPKVSVFADKMREYSAPDEPIFAMEAFWVVIEADRTLLPGLSMAQYSYLQASRDEALAHAAVNGDIVVEYLQQRLAPVVMLTDLDMDLIRASGHQSPVKEALEQGYDLQLHESVFGQRNEDAWLYVRRDP